MSNIFEVIALDENLQIVALLSPTNVQWNRKFYQSGTFSIQLPSNQYNSSFKYIFTKDRPEVGEISQINYQIVNNVQWIQISGFFLEEQLNRRICYKKSTDTNITNEPAWQEQAGAAETVALAYFNAFKDISFTAGGQNYVSRLGIDAQPSQGRGKQSNHARDDAYLANKMHQILKPSRMSYKINYDLNTNEKTLEIYSGFDRTQQNSAGNNPIIFSTEYGNIKKPNVVWSSTDYKNCYVVVSTINQDTEHTVVVAGNEAQSSDLSDNYLSVTSAVNSSDYSTIAEIQEAMKRDAHNALLEKPVKMSLDLDTILGSYEYMTDFDLGDLCSIELPEIGISVDAVLSGCIEVIKAGNWTLTMEFDI